MSDDLPSQNDVDETAFTPIGQQIDGRRLPFNQQYIFCALRVIFLRDTVLSRIFVKHVPGFFFPEHLGDDLGYIVFIRITAGNKVGTHERAVIDEMGDTFFIVVRVAEFERGKH